MDSLTFSMDTCMARPKHDPTAARHLNAPTRVSTEAVSEPLRKLEISLMRADEYVKSLVIARPCVAQHVALVLPMPRVKLRAAVSRSAEREDTSRSFIGELR